MALKNVEKIRTRVVHGLRNELMRIRQYISMLDGSQETVALMSGDGGLKILTTMSETLMRELGHDEAPGDDSNSPAHRAARRGVSRQASRSVNSRPDVAGAE